jgi:hypothetical protein
MTPSTCQLPAAPIFEVSAITIHHVKQGNAIFYVKLMNSLFYLLIFSKTLTGALVD